MVEPPPVITPTPVYRRTRYRRPVSIQIASWIGFLGVCVSLLLIAWNIYELVYLRIRYRWWHFPGAEDLFAALYVHAAMLIGFLLVLGVSGLARRLQ